MLRSARISRSNLLEKENSGDDSSDDVSRFSLRSGTDGNSAIAISKKRSKMTIVDDDFFVDDSLSKISIERDLVEHASMRNSLVPKSPTFSKGRSLQFVLEHQPSLFASRSSKDGTKSCNSFTGSYDKFLAKSSSGPFRCVPKFFDFSPQVVNFEVGAESEDLSFYPPSESSRTCSYLRGNSPRIVPKAQEIVPNRSTTSEHQEFTPVFFIKPTSSCREREGSCNTSDSTSDVMNKAPPNSRMLYGPDVSTLGDKTFVAPIKEHLLVYRGAEYESPSLDRCLSNSKPTNYDEAGLFFSSLKKTSAPPSFDLSFDTPCRVDSTLTSGGLRKRTPRFSASSPATPSTSFSRSNFVEPSAVIAIVCGVGGASREVGIAAFDIDSPLLSLAQFVDNLSFQKTVSQLHVLHPKEILITNTVNVNGKMTQLFSIISASFPEVKITQVQRVFFNDARGLDYATELCAPHYGAVLLELQHKYYCLSATAAVVKYMEFVSSSVFAKKSLKLVFNVHETSLSIGWHSARVLEIVSNLRDPKNLEHTLFGALARPRTRGGRKLLRTALLQPLTDEDALERRLDLVEEMIEKVDMTGRLRAVLSKFHDVETVMTKLVSRPKRESGSCSEDRIATVVFLKHVLDWVSDLQEIVSNYQSLYGHEFAKALLNPGFRALDEIIAEKIRPEAQYLKGSLRLRAQKCFAIKEGVDRLLDIYRENFNDLLQKMREHHQKLVDDMELPFSLTHSVAKGFHLEISGPRKGKSSVSDLEALYRSLVSDSNFVDVVRRRSKVELTTRFLETLSSRAERTADAIVAVSNEIVKAVFDAALKHVSCLYALSEIVSTLDVLQCFAQTSSDRHWRRPKFGSELALQDSVHPMLGTVIRESGAKVVSNHVYASKDQNFVVVTGPNMCGKSTYLRQIGLVQILAQVGCFVPAVLAHVFIVDSIFTRILSSDDPSNNCSTLQVDLNEVKYILEHVKSSNQRNGIRSLIFVDELCRGTSPQEGEAVAFAIAETLSAFDKCFTFFATHFTQFLPSKMIRFYPNVVAFKFTEGYNSGMDEESNSPKPSKHKITKGVTAHRHYGLKLAESHSFPAFVLTEAEDLARRKMKTYATLTGSFGENDDPTYSMKAKGKDSFTTAATLERMRDERKRRIESRLASRAFTSLRHPELSLDDVVADLKRLQSDAQSLHRLCLSDIEDIRNWSTLPRTPKTPLSEESTPSNRRSKEITPNSSMQTPAQLRTTPLTPNPSALMTSTPNPPQSLRGPLTTFNAAKAQDVNC